MISLQKVIIELMNVDEEDTWKEIRALQGQYDTSLEVIEFEAKKKRTIDNGKEKIQGGAKSKQPAEDDSWMLKDLSLSNYKPFSALSFRSIVDNVVAKNAKPKQKYVDVFSLTGGKLQVDPPSKPKYNLYPYVLNAIA